MFYGIYVAVKNSSVHLGYSLIASTYEINIVHVVYRCLQKFGIFQMDIDV